MGRFSVKFEYSFTNIQILTSQEYETIIGKL